MEFTQDWFSYNIPTLSKLTPLFSGKDIDMLEIGSFEGRSTIWFLQNWLTYPSANISCVDTFEGSVEHGDNNHKNTELKGLYARFENNLLQSGYRIGTVKLKVRKMPSAQYFYTWVHKPMFDVVYIDGSHQASDVYSDLAGAYHHTKSGGYIVCDDYGWPHNYPEHMKPQLAIDSFIACYRDKIEVVDLGYLAILKKIL